MILSFLFKEQNHECPAAGECKELSQVRCLGGVGILFGGTVQLPTQGAGQKGTFVQAADQRRRLDLATSARPATSTNRPIIGGRYRGGVQRIRLCQGGYSVGRC